MVKIRDVSRLEYGKRIRQALGWKGKTQAWLADEIQITRNSLNRIVKGETSHPSATIISAISEALDIPVAFLMGETDDINFHDRGKGSGNGKL